MLGESTNTRTPQFIVVRKNGRIQSIAAFYVQQTKVPLRLSVMKVASFNARALRLFGDRILLRRGQDPGEAFQRVFSTLRQMGRTFDLIWIFTQRIDDPFWRFINSSTPDRQSFRPVVTSTAAEKVHCLTFDRTVDQYKADLRTKPGYPGKTIRRFWRDMKDRAALVRVTEPGQVGGFLQGVDRVYNASWQARTYGERRRDLPEEIARLETIAQLGYLRSYLLTEDGTPSAFILGYQYRGRYLYDETGYDSARSSSSPGSILTHAAIEDLFGFNTPSMLDFGFGDGAYKRTFGTASYEVCSVYVVRRGRWRLVLGAQQALNAADRAARAALVRTGLDVKIRRILKRQR
jgi:hypothetical protein